MVRFSLALVLALAATPVVAQTQVDPAALPANGSDAEPAPDVQAANAEIAAQAALTGNAASVVNAAAQRRYARDVARYRAAQRARRNVIAQDAATSARNEQAYASAMADWRAQVAACRRGRTRACEAPSPNPANY